MVNVQVHALVEVDNQAHAPVKKLVQVVLLLDVAKTMDKIVALILNAVLVNVILILANAQ